MLQIDVRLSLDDVVVTGIDGSLIIRITFKSTNSDVIDDIENILNDPIKVEVFQVNECV